MSDRTSFTDVKRALSMRAEMQPEMYGGDNCDEMEPEWFCYGEGDKDADRQREPLTLDAASFPPGTLIEISEPLCPSCDTYRPPKEGAWGGPYVDKCECGFDWKAWEEEQYG